MGYRRFAPGEQPFEVPMVEVLARNWWLVGLRGIAALVFGLLTLFNPAVSLAVLILFFGAYALVYGLFMAVGAVANRRGERSWGAMLAGGILGVLIGVVTFMMPGLTALTLVFLIAAWAVLTGAAEIATGIRLRREISGEWLLILAGLISVAFGVVLAFFPGAGALALTLWIGAWAVVLGIIQIMVAVRLRSWKRSHPAAGELRTA